MLPGQKAMAIADVGRIGNLMQPFEIFDGGHTALEWRQSVNAVTLCGSHGNCKGKEDDGDDVSHYIIIFIGGAVSHRS